MKKTKRLLSLLTALIITASAFASLVIPANAAVTPYSQDYEATDVAADWTSSNTSRYSATVEADGGNHYLEIKALDVTGDNPGSNGTTVSTNTNYTGTVAEGDDFTMTFDLSLTPGNNQGGTNFKINSPGGGYILELQQNGSASKVVKINGNAEQTLSFEGSPWYHFILSRKDDVTFLTVKNTSNEDVFAKQAILTNGAGGISGMTFTTGRYSTNLKIDNVVIRALEDGDVPDIKYYNAVINTTRYATITYGDEKAYADVNGVVKLPLLTSGTVINYTLSKTGYESTTGTIEIENDNVTQNKPLTIINDGSEEEAIYAESDFGNANNAFVTPKGERGASVQLGTIELPTMATFTFDFTMDKNEEKQASLAVNSDTAKLFGLQADTTGLYAWTGWQGSAAMNNDGTDLKKTDSSPYANGLKLADSGVGTNRISFVINRTATEQYPYGTVTVKCGDVTGSLPLTADAATITNMSTGKYRNYATITVDDIVVTRPNPNYVDIAGDSEVAKIKGKTVTRAYSAAPAVMVPGEAFTWSVKTEEGGDPTGVTISEDGVLSITDAAAPGKVVVKAVSDAVAEGAKNGSMVVTIGDYQEFTVKTEGPKAFDVNDENGATYVVTSVVDGMDDEVKDLVTPVWSSSNTDVATIDSATGKLTVVGAGTANIIATITNDDKVSTASIPINVAKYSVTANATGDATNVDLTGIVSDGVVGYLVTTADADGKQVAQTTLDVDDIKNATESKLTCPQAAIKITAVYTADGQLTSVTTDNVAIDSVITEIGDVSEQGASTKKFVYYWDDIDTMEPVEPVLSQVPVVGGEVEVDTTDAAKVEIAPIYETTLGTTLAVPADRYNVTATVSNGRRSDLYVNDQMLINNLNQGSDNWNIVDGETVIGGGRTIAESTDYEAHDIVISQGYAKFNLRDDQSGGTLVTKVKFAKAPSIVNRAKRVYAIGDSLVAKYYGTPAEGYEAQVRTGWGDVLQNYIKDAEVTNLGNSGAWATGMLSDAFTNVAESAQAGDVLILESGYNDKSHSTVAAMTEAVTEMVHRACDLGMTVFVVTPNASVHDFKESVAWAGDIKTICNDINTADDDYEVNVIDLSAESYKYLATHYGLNLADGSAARNLLLTYYNNTGDTLHSTANAANVWAAVVATGVKAVLPDIIDTEYTYTLDDGVNEIAIKAGMDFAGDYQFSITAPDGFDVTDEDEQTITTAAYGDTVTVTLPTGVDAGEVLINDGAVTFEEGEGNITFVMPIGDVTVAVKTYSVTLATGSASLIKRVDAEGAASAAIVAAHGETVYFKAADGVTLETVKITYTPEGGSETEETLTPSEGIYSFTMPKAAVTVTATAQAS